MKCRRAKALIFDFIDGLISDSDRITLEQHLGECPSCEATAVGLTRSLDLLHRVPQAQPDENFNWKLRLAIAKERDAATRRTTGQGAWPRAWNTRFATSAAAAFAVVITAGYLAVRSFDTPPDTPAVLPAAKTASPRVARENVPTVLPQRSLVTDPGVTPRVVSTDPQPGRSGPTGLIEAFDADSLVNHFAQKQALQMRARVLEEQVKLLQNELRTCEGGRNPR